MQYMTIYHDWHGEFSWNLDNGRIYIHKRGLDPNDPNTTKHQIGIANTYDNAIANALIYRGWGSAID